MDKKQVADILSEIGTLLEVKGENPFKCRAYHAGARIVTSLTQDLSVLVTSGEIRNIKGIGDALSEKITELVTTGKLEYYEKLKSSVPPGVLQMLSIGGIGPAKVRVLSTTLKIATLDELEKACKEGKIRSVEGFGKKTEENILAGLSALKTYSARHLISSAEPVAKTMAAFVAKLKGVSRVEIAGSLRRRAETIGDIDILAVAKESEAAAVMQSFTSHPDVERITAHGATKSSVILLSGISCDLRIVNELEFPFALNYFTGSKEHNVRLRSLAREAGYSLNEYGFSKIESQEKRGASKQAFRCKDEEDIYRMLGLAYVPPELREDCGEFEKAQEKKLPQLVTEQDIKGTFHCHTTHSDGAHSLSEMANAARTLGWQYLGIADHSISASYANGMTEQRLKKQQKEIDLLNQNWSNFRILKGVEVDILADGSLDFSDDVLAGCDYVVASVHSSFKMTEQQMTERIVQAISNRNVTMLGHLSGRLLLQRESYPLNQEQVVDAAAKCGTIIEINAHPTRLELNWRMCRYAKEKGVRVAINPDAHTMNGLKDVRFGVGIARKGWLTRQDVLNSMTLKEVQQFLVRRKKERE
ncbi:MAG: DNA polymerase/3'-5' exonuclease PolX [Ignavibacteriales bacterium]|nr:DNA polymerase/3'-5' exonuclease PolX [Ignavibacteriales bacterium]